MLKYKNKKAAKLLSLAIALECVGGTMTPAFASVDVGVIEGKKEGDSDKVLLAGPIESTYKNHKIKIENNCFSIDNDDTICVDVNDAPLTTDFVMREAKESVDKLVKIENETPVKLNKDYSKPDKEISYKGYKIKQKDNCVLLGGYWEGCVNNIDEKGNETNQISQADIDKLINRAKEAADNNIEKQKTYQENGLEYYVNEDTGCYAFKGDSEYTCVGYESNEKSLKKLAQTKMNQKIKEKEYNAAKNSEENLKQTIGNIIELKDEDDDLQYVNKVLQLMTDSSGKQKPSEILRSYIESAEKDKAESEKAGTPINKTTQAILDMSDRLTKIAETATSSTETYPSVMKTNDIKIYTQALAELKSCNAKNALNEAKGEKTETCAFTDEQQAAMNRLISNNAIVEAVKKSTQQTNQTSSDAKTTNATPTTGSSSEKTETTNTTSTTDSSSEKSETKKITQKECPNGTVLSGNEKCCPSAEPIYDSNSNTCTTGTVTETSDNKKTKSSNNNDMLQMLAMLGMGGMGSMIGNGGDKSSIHSGDGKQADENNKNNSGQINRGIKYSFNYQIANTGNTPITYLPLNSEAVEFKLFGAPAADRLQQKLEEKLKNQAAQNNNGKRSKTDTKVIRKIKMYVPTVFSMDVKDDTARRIYSVDLDIQENKPVKLFSTTTDGNVWSKTITRNGSQIKLTHMMRLPAKDFADKLGKNYWEAKVVYSFYDSQNHLLASPLEYIIPFDFNQTTTFLGAFNKMQAKDVDMIETQEPEIKFKGTVESATWDGGQCVVSMSGDILSGQTPSGNGSFPWRTNAITKKGCEELKAGSNIEINNAYITEDGNFKTDAQHNSYFTVDGNWNSSNYDYQNGVTGIGGVSIKLGNMQFNDNKITFDKDGNAVLWSKRNTNNGGSSAEGQWEPWRYPNDINYINKQLGLEGDKAVTKLESCNLGIGDTNLCAVHANGQKDTTPINSGSVDTKTTIQFNTNGGLLLGDKGPSTSEQIDYLSRDGGRVSIDYFANQSPLKKVQNVMREAVNKTIETAKQAAITTIGNFSIGGAKDSSKDNDYQLNAGESSYGWNGKDVRDVDLRKLSTNNSTTSQENDNKVDEKENSEYTFNNKFEPLNPFDNKNARNSFNPLTGDNGYNSVWGGLGLGNGLLSGLGTNNSTSSNSSNNSESDSTTTETVVENNQSSASTNLTPDQINKLAEIKEQHDYVVNNLTSKQKSFLNKSNEVKGVNKQAAKRGLLAQLQKEAKSVGLPTNLITLDDKNIEYTQNPDGTWSAKGTPSLR